MSDAPETTDSTPQSLDGAPPNGPDATSHDEAPAPPIESASLDNDAPTADASSSEERPSERVASDESASDDSASDSASGEIRADGEAGDDGGEGEEPAGDEGAAAESGEGEPGRPKRKRRRRRKKKGAITEAGAEAPAEEGAPHEGRERGDKKQRPASNAPFIHLFDGGHGRKHAFAVGEIVAGKVARIADGAVVVDLFGKALAILDEHEPHEVEPYPEPVAPVPAPAEATPETAVEGEGAPAVVVARTIAISDVPPPVDAPADAASVDPGSVALSAPAAELASVEPEVADLDFEHDEEEPDDEASEAGSMEAPLAPEPPPPEPPPLGSIFRGRVGAVAESGHVAIVNRAIDRAAAKAALEAARDNRWRVRGVVFGFNRGGFDVLVEGVRVFCPASGMSLDPIHDPEPFIAKKLEFSIPQKKAGLHGLVVSRRTILERDQKRARRTRLKELREGEVVRGRVTQVREFGVFVDLGLGLEGLVHMSELSYNRGVRPSDVAKPGDEVDVKILRIGGEPKGEDRDKKRRDRQTRIGLSMKALLADPWNEHGAALEPGAYRKGKVVRTTDFGAFIELAPGIEGLLHISELGKDLKHAGQVLNEGEDIDVVIERLDHDQRRISLSRLSSQDAQAIQEGKLDLSARPRALKPGTHVMVVIEKADHHGLFVQVKGVLGKRGRGYLPNRELGSKDSGDKRKSFSPGSELEVKIVGVDRDGSLRCSIKGKEIDDERKAVRDYRKESARQGFGTFGDLLRAKLPSDDGN
jgi:small subunit ribosomal protein S1